MRSSWFRFKGSKQSTLTATTFTAVTAVAVAGALLHPGFQRADVELNDGGVWVINQSEDLVGHLNYQSRILDGGLVSTGSSFDILQEAGRVLVRDMEQASVASVDVSRVALQDQSRLPANGDMSFGESVLAVSDPDGGRVWAAASDSLGTLASGSAEPLHESEGPVLSAVSRTDEVFVADTEAEKLFVYDVLGPSGPQELRTEDLAGLAELSEPQLSVIGDKAVVFDPASGTVLLPGGGQTTLEGAAGGKLQQPGPAAQDAVVALDKALVSVPLGGGTPRSTPLETAGAPIAPVSVGECVHAAWNGSGIYVRDCKDNGADLTEPVPAVDAGTQLAFRVNRGVVVLNDIRGGNVWLVEDGMQIVDNWSDLQPPEGEGSDETEESSEVTDTIELPDRTGENRPPIAVDDDFGVRPGRTTMLPMLFNDTDPDGDLLTGQLIGEQPSVGTVQSIYDATGLQVVVPPNAAGADTIEYEVADGRGGADSGTVRIRVVSPESNAAPNQLRTSTIRLEQGKSISQNVLTDWIDPDGDDLQLIGATVEGGDIVRVRPDGVLTFQDVGTSFGMKEVTVTVSDGREAARGKVLLDVQPRGPVPPVANPDHVSAVAGREVTISPLKNDVDPNGGQLRLATVDSLPDVTIKPNTDAGTISFSAAAPRTYYLEYLVSNGPASTPGLIRVDVQAAESGVGEPVAVRDLALLPANGETFVNVLANDQDPAGGVLVVQSVAVPEDAPISVSIEDHSILRVVDSRGLTQPVTIGYTISNGQGTAAGEVTVVPVPAPTQLQPPQANSDEAVVRAGDVVTIPVLANDEHPNGASLTLKPELAETVAPADGLITVADNMIRFRAGAEAKTVSAVYTVAGPDGQEASARVSITILDPGQNAPPLPEAVTGRVLAGNTAVILIPLDGIDPDGDSVSLIGLDQAPRKGTAKAGAAAIEYTAGANQSGTDTFTYVVEDRLGARATGSISIGIAPAAADNHPPVAVDDFIQVRPDRPVAVDVLGNDTDPDGDRLGFVAGSLEPSAPSDAAIVDGRVVLTSPAQPGFLSVRYAVTDNRGGTSVGTLTVESSPTAPLKAPIARDDRVAFGETVGKTEVTVPILENDEDPDGRVDELQLSFPDGGTGIALLGDRTLSVQLRAEAQVIPYTLTDVDGLVTTGFVMVPGGGEARPVLRSDAVLEVLSGDELGLDLNQLVLVRDGRSPRITGEGMVSSAPESASPLVASATALAFRSAEGYVGPASVTFEVTDGTGPDDPQGLKAVLTVPITVLPRPETNQPPSIQSNSLQVAQGEDPVSTDLRLMATDTDPGDQQLLKFAVVEGSIPGVNVSLDGSRLSVGAEASTPKGTSGAIKVSVTDGKSDPVTATVAVQVVSTNRSLPVANPDVVEDAHQGRTETVNVLRNDVNPFPDTPLKIVGASSAVVGGGAVISGSDLQITAPATFVGTMTVDYIVQDKTQDADRQVTGTVTLNVKGKPEVPTTPLVESVTDRQVVLSWSAPANNGSPITGYTVTANGFSQECRTTNCTLTGLTNNVEYQFQVAATNAVGTSDPSGASEVARPDVKPDQPAAPTGVDGDRTATVSWLTPATKGSPVKSYNVEISPAPANGESQRLGITGNSMTWNGLTNGTAYKFRVQAVSSAVEPSAWSAYSATITPAGVPFKPLAPTAAREDSQVNGGVVNVSWKAPQNNGAAVTGYDLRIYQGGSLVDSRPGLTGTSLAITGLSTTGSYSFDVTAQNRVGASEPSARSNTVTPYGRPLAPGSVSAAATGSNHQIRLSFPAAAGNGNAVSGYQYSVDGGGWKDIGGSGSSVNVGDNGTNHTFRVRGVNAAGAGDPSGASNAMSAYGPVQDGGGRSSSHGDDWAQFNWNANANAYANGRPVTLTVTDGSAGSGSHRYNGLGWSTTRNFTVTATPSEGEARSWTMSETTNPKPEPPPRTVTLNRGDQVFDANCNTECYKFKVELNNFAANTTFIVQCMDDGGRFNGYDHTVTTNGNGYTNQQINCWHGRGGNFYARVDGVDSAKRNSW